MNGYEKPHPRTNYYQNNGYDERWEMEADSYDNRNYPMEETNGGYLNEQWNNDNGYHDNITYDSTDETVFDDRDNSRELVHPEDQREVVNELFTRTEDSIPPQPDHPPQNADDMFENFKTGPFPKKRTSQKVKREEKTESATEKEKVDKKENSWLKKPGKPIIKKRNTEKKKSECPQKTIMFATLVPALMRQRTTERVKSILGTKFRFHFNPGAKKIDVISRVMFPGTFACLNIAYWSYYLTTAEQASLDSL